MKGSFLKIQKSEISADGMNQYLKNKNKTIHCFDALDSTNTALKKMAHEGAVEGTVLVTQMQTAGRGRLGKTFFSPKGCGIYFSLLLRPKCRVQDACLITAGAAVAVHRAFLALFGLNTQIKWVNDIYYNGKKLCGILTESSVDAASDKLRFAVLGIGLNIKTPEEGYPEEFAFKTTNLSETNISLSEDFKNRLIAEILNQFDSIYACLLQKEYMEEYKAASCLLGKEIDILSGQYVGKALALDIDQDANLVVRLPDGSINKLSSGDVSIALLPENLRSSGSM